MPVKERVPAQVGGVVGAQGHDADVSRPDPAAGPRLAAGAVVHQGDALLELPRRELMRRRTVGQQPGAGCVAGHDVRHIHQVVVVAVPRKDQRHVRESDLEGGQGRIDPWGVLGDGVEPHAQERGVAEEGRGQNGAPAPPHEPAPGPQVGELHRWAGDRAAGDADRPLGARTHQGQRGRAAGRAEESRQTEGGGPAQRRWAAASGDRLTPVRRPQPSRARPPRGTRPSAASPPAPRARRRSAARRSARWAVPRWWCP